MMVEFMEVIKLLSEFGIMLVIVGIFLYVVIRIINIQLNKWESSVKGKKHDELVNIRADIGTNIQFLIDEFLVESKGNRVQVIEFSNSVTSVAYLPFRYMTCTYEVYKLGKTGTGHKIDRISTSLFTKFFETLQNNDYCVFNIDEDPTIVGGAMCELMQSQHEHQALCALLKSPKGKSIGYVELTKDDKFTKSDKDNIEELAHKLSTLLSVADK